MPVGTKATVKTLHPDEVRDLGAQILLGNTYHLHFRPGDELIRDLGGLHRFMALGRRRSSPTPAASRSSRCATRSRASTTTASRSAASTTARERASRPSSPRAIQANLGSDIAMCLDQVPPAGVARARARGCRAPDDRCGRERQRDAPRAEGQLRFGITQGGVDPELRRRSTEEIAELDFDGNAIGGLAIGEDRDAMFETTDWAAALLPADKPRYFMGIGDPEGILEVIEAGRRHVRLRPPDAHRPHRQRAHVARAGSTCATRASPATSAPLDEELRLPGLHALHPRLHPPPREPERAARPAPALAPQSTLPARADPRRARRRSSAARSPPTSATHSKGSAVGGFLIIIVVLRRRLAASSSLPARRRQRSHAAMQDSVEVGDEIITAGGLHGVVREDDRRRAARSRSRPDVVVDARPPRGRGGGARDRGRGRAEDEPERAGSRWTRSEPS